MAFPRPALARDATFLDTLAALVLEEAIGTIVIGLPLALSGNETASTIDAQQLFEEVLEKIGDIPVVQWMSGSRRWPHKNRCQRLDCV